MYKTGNYFIDTLSQVYLFFPLLPAIAVVLKSAYRRETLNFLMILCLFNFIKNMVLIFPGMMPQNHAIVENVFSLIELVLLVQLFKPLVHPTWKYLVMILFVAFISSVITFYLLEGLTQKHASLQELQEMIVIVVSVLGLITLVPDKDLFILRAPLFWIATGTIFYFSISALVRIIGQPLPLSDIFRDVNDQGILVIAGLVRYLFYVLAVFFDEPGDHQPGKNAAAQ